MTILHSKPRDLYPGDTMRILTRDAESSDGTHYYAGTEYQPQASGHDSVRGADYQDALIVGRTWNHDARFFARR